MVKHCKKFERWYFTYSKFNLNKNKLSKINGMKMTWIQNIWNEVLGQSENIIIDFVDIIFCNNMNVDENNYTF